MTVDTKTYCVNANCPFKKCDKRLQQLENIDSQNKHINIANLDSVCRDYLYYLLNEIRASE